MAKIVLGLGSSHTPMLTLPANEWLTRAQADHVNPSLNMSDGRLLSYDQLLAEKQPRAIALEELEIQAAACQAALDRLADELQAANPDVVIIIGDDQQELFGPDNQPAIAIYWGELVRTHSEYEDEALPDWVKRVGNGYMMDAVHDLPGAPELGFELITALIEKGIDVGSCGSVKDPTIAGFGHAFGFIAKRLMRGKPIPVLPILLNTYYAPNVPTARRCHDIGNALADALAHVNSVARVAIVASGGLSHFVVDEALDRRVLDGLQPGGAELLRSIERGALNSGSSEILNWVMLASAVGEIPLNWAEYYPIYRTPAGTGVGVCFAAWTTAGSADQAAEDVK